MPKKSILSDLDFTTRIRYLGLIALGAILVMGCGREKIAEKYPSGKPKVIRTYGWLGGQTQANLKREQTFYFNNHKEADIHFSHGKRHGQYLDYSHNGQKKSEGQFEKGKKEGEWTFYYNQFTVSAKGRFHENHKEGRWQQYWENGETKAQGTFRAGKEIDTLKEWSSKGETLVENSCFESNEQGHYRTFHGNQSIKEDYACLKGVPTGDYFRKDPEGMIVEKGRFDSLGRKDGAWETFATEGKPTSLKHYLAGQENDSSYVWDAAGRLREQGWFSNGQGERLSYDSLGRLIEKQHFEAGHPEGEAWVYFPSGAKRSLVLYKGGLAVELHKWHPNGQLRAYGLYSAGKATGEWNEYGADGTLMETSHYVEGILHGDQLFYDAKGKLTRTLRYEHGYPAEGKIPASIAAGLNKKSAVRDSSQDSLLKN